MIRKTLTIFSLIGLLLSVGLWGASYFRASYMTDDSVCELTMGVLRWDTNFKHRLSELIAKKEHFMERLTSSYQPATERRVQVLEEMLGEAGLYERNPAYPRGSRKQALAGLGGSITSLRSLEKSRGWRCLGFVGFRTIWWPTGGLMIYWWAVQANTGVFVVPLWLPTIIFALCPLYALLPSHRRRNRKKLGLCLQCGYDLRGSSERCPECGREFETA